MKKKLLILIDTIKPMVDGVSIFLDNLIPYFREEYDVTIIAPNYGEVHYENVRLIQFPVYNLLFSDYGLPKINKKIIKREVKECDIIFNNESVSPFSASFYASIYAKKYNKPFITYVHSIDWELFTESIKLFWGIKKIEKIFLKIYGRWFLNNCNTIIVSFPTIKNILIGNQITGNFEIVPIGVSDIFKPGEKNSFYNNGIILGFVGRLSREKGVQLLFDVFNRLNSKFDDLSLLLVGSGPEEWKFDEKKNVTITGFVSQKEVADYLRIMDIFVLPSVTEANSLSTLEAIKSGVCCVTKDVGAIRDYLKNGYNGYLFKTQEELMDILEKLIGDESLRKRLSDNAGKTGMKYTWKNTADCLIVVLEKYYLSQS